VYRKPVAPPTGTCVQSASDLGLTLTIDPNCPPRSHTFPSAERRVYRTADRHSRASSGSRRRKHGSTNSKQQPADRQNIRRPAAHRHASEDLRQKLQIAADAVMNPHLAANSEMPLRARTISPTVDGSQCYPAEQRHSHANPMRSPEPRMHPRKHIERHEQRVSDEEEDVEKLVQQCRFPTTNWSVLNA
jgi:hypothetical protein